MHPINDIIAQRRSIYPKEFTGEPVDDSVINTLLSNAHWAPSHASTYPWLFKVMKAESLEKWANFAAEQYKSGTSAEKFKQDKMDKILNYTKQASHVIAICMKRDPNERIPQQEEQWAVACAVQNIYLSLAQFPDVGGYWSTGNGTFSESMKQYFNLGDKDMLMGYFFIGKVTEKRTDSKRPGYESHVEWL